MDNLKKYLKTRLEYAETGDASLIARLIGFRDYVVDNFRPKKFDPFDSDNEIIQKERDFEMMCSAMEEAGIHNCKEMTIFEFYTRIRHFEKRNKPNNNGN